MSAPHKWRPSLGMITGALIASVLLLPLSGLVFFRLYENQLIRQTEAELIGQVAVFAAAVEAEIAAEPGEVFPIGAQKPPETTLDPDGRYAPIAPRLDLAASAIAPPRPEARAAPPVNPEALRMGAGFEAIARRAQRTTLAGFRVLDANGVVITGRDEVGLSLAHVGEVREAMAGRFSVALRMRIRDAPPPPIYSISRGTNIRIFAAMPVFVGEHVRAVVYASRTPDNILRNLYRERGRLSVAALVMIVAASLIGVVFVRTVTRPVRELAARAEAISRGRREAIGGLAQYGTREFAALSASFMRMARRLFDRSDYVGAFATHVSHELKAPLASIKGAVELLLDANADMTDEERRRFLGNILADADRMALLLTRLRELARAENPEFDGSCLLSEVVARLRGADGRLEALLGGEDARLAMSLENAAIILGHLADNAARHGATRLSISAVEEDGAVLVRVADNGSGVSAANRARIFDPFFTTRRAEGGTGMGLGIARALARAHGGDLSLAESESGAAFELRLPRGQD